MARILSCGSGVGPAIAQIRTLAWEPPYVMSVALKKKKEKEKEKGKKIEIPPAYKTPRNLIRGKGTGPLQRSSGGWNCRLSLFSPSFKKLTPCRRGDTWTAFINILMQFLKNK